MSVLIKGMDMPTSCYDCQFAVDGMCVAMQPISTRNWREKETTNFCPLVPIPDHGDLIDRDELERMLEINEDCNKCIHRASFCCDREPDFVDACEAIYVAPVVIPAERSEDGET